MHLSITPTFTLSSSVEIFIYIRSNLGFTHHFPFLITLLWNDKYNVIKQRFYKTPKQLYFSIVLKDFKIFSVCI